MSTGAAAPDATDGLVLASARGRWVLLATVLGSAIASIDATVVGIALPAIGRDFHVGLAALQWVVTAYTMTLAGLLLLAGSLGDKYGRKKVFLIGVVWFAVASLLCAVAPDADVPDPGPGPAGRRRGAADPGQPGHPGGVVPARRPGQGHRRLVGVRRGGHRDRPVPRRLADPGGVLAADLRDQPAAGRPGGRGEPAARPRVP